MLDIKGFNQLCQGKHGYFLYNKHDTFVGKALATYGEWSEEEVELFRSLCKTGNIVVEAGSNIGSHTVPLAKIIGKSGQVHAIEAQIVIFQKLCANIALNSLPNVVCYNVAVGAEEGHVFLPKLSYERENNYGGIRANKLTEGIKTRKAALDTLLELENLHLLKADVEGMELEAIRGAERLISQFSPILYLESEPEKETTPELIQYLLDRHYTLYWHVPKLFNPNNYANNAENIFGNFASFNLLCLPKGKALEADKAAFRLKKITSADDKPF